jgi:hypothetical protein
MEKKSLTLFLAGILIIFIILNIIFIYEEKVTGDALKSLELQEQSQKLPRESQEELQKIQKQQQAIQAAEIAQTPSNIQKQPYDTSKEIIGGTR